MFNIAVYLMGGFGNQLFQYFHAIKLQEEGYRVCLLGDWFIKTKPSVTARELEIHKLPNFEIPIILASDLIEQGYTLAPFKSEVQNEKLVQYKYDYFQNASEMPSAEWLQNFYTLLPINPKFIGLTTMHIRLGDYIKLGWNLPVQYYENIFLNNPEATFVIFCENQVETRFYLRMVNSKNYIFADMVDPDIGNDVLSDFFAMSSSKIIFGSNSTFSYLSGLAVGFRGGIAHTPTSHYWEWFDKERLTTGKSLFDYKFITMIN
jgi:hypothetical protein